MDEAEEDLSGLHPGALLYRSAALQMFPVMADALAHGADVNWVNVAEESSTPLIQAVTAVRTAFNPISHACHPFSKKKKTSASTCTVQTFVLLF